MFNQITKSSNNLSAGTYSVERIFFAEASSYERVHQKFAYRALSLASLDRTRMLTQYRTSSTS